MTMVFIHINRIPNWFTLQVVQTIALIAVREGVIQLGSVHKVLEDPSYVCILQKRFSYLERIPGVLLPHPLSSSFPYKVDGHAAQNAWAFQPNMTPPFPVTEFYDQFGQPIKITPSMSSLEALLAKLPSVVPATSPSSSGYCEPIPHFSSAHKPLELNGGVASKDDSDGEYRQETEVGESSSSMSQYYDNQQYHQFNLGGSRSNKGF